MSAPLYTTKLGNDILTEIVNAVDGLLNAANIHLFQNDYEPLKSSVVGDFVEADFTGYAAIAATWNTTPYNEGDVSRIATQLANFVAGAAPTAQTIYGWYVTDSADAEVFFARRFDNPVPITAENDVVTAQVEFTM